MSVSLNLSTLSAAKTDSKFHLLPCNIQYDGDASVEQFFSTSIRKEDKDKNGRPRSRICAYDNNMAR